MSEIPKLKLCESVFVENIGNKDEINFVINNHNKEYIITLRSLKEVNAFYDKYKDNDYLFAKDFPELDLICYKTHKHFKDWLHDYLYKVE